MDRLRAAVVREVTNARELGIAVFFVGVGSAVGGIVYELDPFSSGKRSREPERHPDGSAVISRREDAGMRALAKAGGDPDRYLVAAERGEPRMVHSRRRIGRRGPGLPAG